MNNKMLAYAFGMLVSGLAYGSSAEAQAVEFTNCNVVDVGVHAVGTADARVVARCSAAVADGVWWLAMPLGGPGADKFEDVATAAFLSGRPLRGWVNGPIGTGCSAACRKVTDFSVYK